MSTGQLGPISLQFVSSVSQLMQGVFNARPAQLKYTFIWDAQMVLNFIKEIWRNNRGTFFEIDNVDRIGNCIKGN